MRQETGGGLFGPSEERGDIARFEAVAQAIEDCVDLLHVEKPPGHLLVIDLLLEELFGGVAEGGMPDIVHESRNPHLTPGTAPGIRLERAGALGGQGVVDPAGELHGAQNMAEAAVLGAGKDEVGEAELMYRAQPLDRLAVDQRLLERIGMDKAVYRIAKRDTSFAHDR